MNFTTSIFIVHATQALDRQFWFELNHFVTLAHENPKKAEPQS